MAHDMPCCFVSLNFNILIFISVMTCEQALYVQLHKIRMFCVLRFSHFYKL